MCAKLRAQDGAITPTFVDWECFHKFTDSIAVLQQRLGWVFWGVVVFVCFLKNCIVMCDFFPPTKFMEESHLHRKGKNHTTGIKQSAWKEPHVSNMWTQYFVIANGTGTCNIGCCADLYSNSVYNTYLVVWQGGNLTAVSQNPDFSFSTMDVFLTSLLFLLFPLLSFTY